MEAALFDVDSSSRETSSVTYSHLSQDVQGDLLELCCVDFSPPTFLTQVVNAEKEVALLPNGEETPARSPNKQVRFRTHTTSQNTSNNIYLLVDPGTHLPPPLLTATHLSSTLETHEGSDLPSVELFELFPAKRPTPFKTDTTSLLNVTNSIRGHTHQNPDEVRKFLQPEFARMMTTKYSVDLPDASDLAIDMSPGREKAARSIDVVIADLQKGRKITQLKSQERELAVGKHLKQLSVADKKEDTIDEADEEIEVTELDEILPSAGVKKVSEQRRADHAIFNSFIESEQRKKDRISKSTITGDDETQSIKWLMKLAESQKIITTPREYQVELFELAKEKNIIAVLDTGSGKTLIAVLLLRHIIKQELEDRHEGKKPRISFFLVDSVTLVFQQYAVLECNLDQKMDRFCGDMGCDLWSKELWQKHFKENMVIVCTAEVLYQCLHHAFISIDQINLLIFDEAHHAKKNHSYARIIKDFYSQEDAATVLPRIFGMTASPVDAKTDVKKAAAELEALLHCQIATTTDPSLMQFSVDHKIEEVLQYQPLRVQYQTPLCYRIKSVVGHMGVFAKPLEYAKYASAELGAWCADQVWVFCLADDEFSKLTAKTERKFNTQKLTESTMILDAQKAKIEEARGLVASHTFARPTLSLDQLSSKVLEIVQYLRERFSRPTEDRCIVFVQQRYTARLLTELFSQPEIGTTYLRAGALVGTRTGEAADLNVSFRQQVLTMNRFRRGVLNCLFATSVAEEGLDIPECNLVIRFDLYSTLIQYIQSRGRARLKNSKYLHMIERGNRAHATLIKSVRNDERTLREFCNSLPADRLLSGNSFDMDYFLAKEKSHRVYKEPTTGAKLTYRLSLMVIANFVGSLPQTQETILSAEYFVTVKGKGFICEVVLPETSPMRGGTGRPATTKQVAKCSAAFETCLLLRQGGYLDAHFKSTFVKVLPAMRNALLAISSKKKADYPMRTKPSIWAAGSVPEKLYMTVLSLADPECLRRPSQPLGLLSRASFNQLPSFPIYPAFGKQTDVHMTAIGTDIHLDSSELRLANQFTLRIFEDVFSKEYESDPTKMPYFLVPISRRLEDYTDVNPKQLIDWETLAVVDKSDSLHWNENLPEEFYHDRYLVDPWDGSRKLWSLRVAPQYKPTDPVPQNTAPRSGTRKNNENIMEYSISLWSKARARRTFSETQPVLEAEYIPLTRNLLDNTNYKEIETPKQCFVIPEPLKISALPTTVVAMAYVFPAIIHRIESYLIAMEACVLIGLDIRPDLALEAMTKDSDNSMDHSDEQVHFQRGMGKNYERLEFIGDCFLKMATSISLYTRKPDGNEFDYHVDRMAMICNQNLFNVALDLGVTEYIRSLSFNRRAWYPEGLALKKGKTATAPREHKLADKTVADVSEALIGAALLTHLGTEDPFDQAVRAVTILVDSQDHDILCFAKYYQNYEMPKYQTAASTASQRDMAAQLAAKHPYTFKYPRLARSAFMHPSINYGHENIPCYQRLEFLGDALLDMACINFLFHKYPDRDPQWLTEHKMAMVSNQFLGALCVQLGFHKHLIQFSGVVQKAIMDYVMDINECRMNAEEEAIQAGKSAEDLSPDYWTNSRQPPKCLPDIVEAYVGALFVDSEFNYVEVERFFERNICCFFKDMKLYDSYANKHPVTYLSNFLVLSMGCSNWRFHSAQLPDLGDGAEVEVVATLMIHHDIIINVSGKSTRYAKLLVARKGLELLQGMARSDFRVKFHCDCVGGDPDEIMAGMHANAENDVQDDRLGAAV